MSDLASEFFSLLQLAKEGSVKTEAPTGYPDEIYLSPENGCEFVYLNGGVEIGRRRAKSCEIGAFMRMPRGNK